MALPMDNLMRLLVPNRTPPSGSAMPTIATAGVMPQATPAAAAQPQLSPTAKYIADMQALMSGGVGPLSTGEKISALGQVLQAAGSRGASDPAAVLQSVRNQQMQKLNAQYQIAQLQQSQQREAQQRAAIEKYKIALEPDQINALEGLPLEKQAEKVAEIAFRQDQVREIKRDSDGKTRYIFVSGKSKLADFDLPIGYERIDTGNGFKFYNKDNPTEYLKNASGEEVFVPQQMTAYQRESLGLRRQEIAKADARARAGGGGATNLPQPTVKIVNGKPTNVQWDKRRQKYVPFNQPGLGIPNKGDILAANLAPEVAALLSGVGGVE
jgi:hypothetical protein